MQKLLILTGSTASDAASQIVAFAEDLGYRLVTSTEVENGDNRMFDPTPLAQCVTLPDPKVNSARHNWCKDLTLGDVQQMTILDAWMHLGGCVRSGAQNRAFKSGSMFCEASAAMVARGLNFADQAPIWPFYTANQWKLEFDVAPRIASVLVANQVPSPSLLSRFADEDAWNLGRAGSAGIDAIKALRDRIRRAH